MQIYNDKENNRVYEIDKTKLGSVAEPLETGIGNRYNLDIKDSIEEVEEPIDKEIINK